MTDAGVPTDQPDDAPDDLPAAEPSNAATAPTGAPRRRLGLLRRLGSRLPLRPRSRRGAFVLFMLIAGFGSILTIGAVSVIAYTETPEFCGTCHTMGPEIKGHEISPHRELACVECHTAPGLGPWIEAKLNGTRMLLEVVTGTFPKPIPPPDHSMLPPTTLTCERCHNVTPLLAGGGPIRLVLRERYGFDPASTRQTVALVIRPNGFGSGGRTVGVHWHIDAEVEYLTPDPRAQEIDYVSVRKVDGSFEEFIASRSVTQADNVTADITTLSNTLAARRMNCIDCHNRIGHDLPSASRAVDDQISAGNISTTLPYIKEQAVKRLSMSYASLDDADQSIAGLNYFYATNYPLVARDQSAQISAAIASLQQIYRLVATPEMGAFVSTYPTNIGHQDSPGCFRCHDGAHYKVEAGRLTTETIPSQCSTCHTFPQIGEYESGVLIGRRPATHDGQLWIFDHKLSVGTTDPTGQTCGACHTRTYCENCHATNAVMVSHDKMVFNHGAVAAQGGAGACAYCHAPSYCAQCHAEPVMPLGPAGTGSRPQLPVEYQLIGEVP
ncbi:MAG: NapC/NirT family cytochrome c [Mycobacterium sp.]